MISDLTNDDGTINEKYRGTKSIKLGSVDLIDGDHLHFLLSKLERFIECAPEIYNDTLKYWQSSDGGEILYIYYDRPETDEEVVQRMTQEEDRLRRAEEIDRVLYENLKARFEESSD